MMMFPLLIVLIVLTGLLIATILVLLLSSTQQDNLQQGNSQAFHDIPPTLHFLWYGGPEPETMKRARRTWETKFPGCTTRVWLEEEYDKLFEDTEWETVYKGSLRIHRADLARLLVVYKHGGWYCDHDAFPSDSLSIIDPAIRQHGGLIPYEPMIDKNWLRGLKDHPLREGTPEGGRRLANCFFGAPQAASWLKTLLDGCVARTARAMEVLSQLKQFPTNINMQRYYVLWASGPLAWAEILLQDTSSVSTSVKKEHSTSDIVLRPQHKCVVHHMNFSWRDNYLADIKPKLASGGSSQRKLIVVIICFERFICIDRLLASLPSVAQGVHVIPAIHDNGSTRPDVIEALTRWEASGIDVVRMGKHAKLSAVASTVSTLVRKHSASFYAVTDPDMTFEGSDPSTLHTLIELLPEATKRGATSVAPHLSVRNMPPEYPLRELVLRQYFRVSALADQPDLSTAVAKKINALPWSSIVINGKSAKVAIEPNDTTFSVWNASVSYSAPQLALHVKEPFAIRHTDWELDLRPNGHDLHDTVSYCAKRKSYGQWASLAIPPMEGPATPVRTWMKQEPTNRFYACLKSWMSYYGYWGAHKNVTEAKRLANKMNTMGPLTSLQDSEVWAAFTEWRSNQSVPL